MAQKRTAKHEKRPQQLTTRGKLTGYLWAAGALTLGFTFLIFQLYQIMVVDGEFYHARAAAQQMMDQTITATRGEVFDATGKTLIQSNIVWDITCDPFDSVGLTDGEGNTREFICRELAAGLSALLGTEEETLYARITDCESKYKVLANKVDKLVADQTRAYIAAFEEKYNGEDGSPKVSFSYTISQNFKRSYPYGQFAGAVLGFCDASGKGIYGVEASYNDVLSGTDGRVITVKNANGLEIANNATTTYEALDGNDLYLTLDANVQEILETYLKEAVAANNVKNRACGIVMNVNTGAILAMSSEPDFDPNQPNEVLNEAYFQEMVLAESEIYGPSVEVDEEGNETPKDMTGIYREIQWKNKAITELYMPGSVFKTVVAAALLDAGLATTDTSFTCSGSLQVNDATFHCADGAVHGTIEMYTAMRKSCNIYFINAIQALGARGFYNYFDAFGFTTTTGIDLPNETHYMQYFDVEGLGNQVQLANSGFGQSMAITPLQMATAMAACVNGGYLVTPHIVDRIEDASGNIVSQTDTTVRRQVISAQASQILCSLLEYTVGTPDDPGNVMAYVAGYRIGGKSGTSEQLNLQRRESDGDYKKISSFVAVFPADDPEYLVYIMLDDPRTVTDYASRLAAPVCGNIISEIAPYLGVEKNGEDLSSQLITVPNLVGKEWSSAQADLNQRGLLHRLVETSTAGETICYQYPAPYTKVYGGTTIYLYTRSAEGSQVSVPNVVGKNAAFARQMLGAAGLNCVVMGEETALVTAQDIEVGSTVQMGTVVTLSCGEG